MLPGGKRAFHKIQAWPRAGGAKVSVHLNPMIFEADPFSSHCAMQERVEMPGFHDLGRGFANVGGRGEIGFAQGEIVNRDAGGFEARGHRGGGHGFGQRGLGRGHHPQ